MDQTTGAISAEVRTPVPAFEEKLDSPWVHQFLEFQEDLEGPADPGDRQLLSRRGIRAPPARWQSDNQRRPWRRIAQTSGDMKWSVSAYPGPGGARGSSLSRDTLEGENEKLHFRRDHSSKVVPVSLDYVVMGLFAGLSWKYDTPGFFSGSGAEMFSKTRMAGRDSCII